MAIYAVGDIQGCVVPFEELLDKLQFSESSDQVWITGDLVNRGPASLETLRLVKKLGNSAVTVLGNHDLHLLSLAEKIKKPRDGDTLSKILKASDRDELVEWLRNRPLVHADESIKTVMSHAGVYPKWTFKKLMKRAAEVERLIRGKDCHAFLRTMYGKEPDHWQSGLDRWDRARFITNALTRMRFCHTDGHLDFEEKGQIGDQAKGIIPWFEYPKRKCQDWRIVFGHWSALGYKNMGNVLSLDSGCVWGGCLTAVQLDTKKVRVCQVECPKS